MKNVSPFKNTVRFLTVATLAGLSSPVFAQTKAAAKSEVTWKEIGTAPGVVAMAAVGKNLFAITSAKKLQVCEPATTPVVWKEIGNGPGGNVVAMGVSEGKLFASTDARSAGRLATRDAVTTASAWQDLGHAWCLLAMAGAPGKMYAIVDTKEVGSEATVMVRENAGTATANAGQGLDGIPWNGVDRRPPVGALAMTEVGGKYYVATKEDALYVGNPTKPDVKWQQIGDAAGVTILAGADGKLFATTKTGKLMMWAPK
ncbi:MAG: hypothetical protein NTW21_29505 [Verrucomicrobia bacterium]|nr:hypothetical protein [Verrucomicrobiota bacterium]